MTYAMQLCEWVDILNIEKELQKLGNLLNIMCLGFIGWRGWRWTAEWFKGRVDEAL